MRRAFHWIQLVLGAVVVVGVWLQVYFIASYFRGAEDALDLHEAIGGAVVHPAEVLAFLVAFGAWPRDRGKIGHSFGLAALGTVQVALAGGSNWVGGLHGLLALAVLVMAVFVVKWNAEALGLMRGRGGGGESAAPPQPLP
jgi:hypothetical protein